MELGRKQQQRYGGLLQENIRRLLEEHHSTSMQEAELEEGEKRALDDESVAANQYVNQEIEEKRVEMARPQPCSAATPPPLDHANHRSREERVRE